MLRYLLTFVQTLMYFDNVEAVFSVCKLESIDAFRRAVFSQRF